jgi:hypothetical protein
MLTHFAGKDSSYSRLFEWTTRTFESALTREKAGPRPTYGCVCCCRDKDPLRAAAPLTHAWRTPTSNRAHYRAFLGSSGAEFDSSYARSQPLIFKACSCMCVGAELWRCRGAKKGSGDCVVGCKSRESQASSQMWL